VLGKDDWQVPSLSGSEYFEKINAPRKRLFWIENAGHVADMDNPKDFAEAVSKIVEDINIF